jgi:hypothetical protein
MKANGAAGYTLMAVLIAVAILGMIVLGVAQGVRFGLSAWDRQSREIAARDDIGTTDRLIRTLIAQAEPAGEDEQPHLRGAKGAVLLWTRLSLAAELAGIGMVEAAIGVDGQHRLMLRASPNPSAERLRVAPMIEEILLSDVDHITLSYWLLGQNGRAGAWTETWSSVDLPALIRIRIVFLPNTRRHWPDIIASPQRHRTNPS